MALAPRLAALKGNLLARGFPLVGDELLKLTVRTAPWGYRGEEVAQILESQNIFPEFADESHIVFMFTPENTPEELARLEQALLALPKREPRNCVLLQCRPEAVLTPRQAAFSQKETLEVFQSQGRILADSSVSCPPAVPLVMCGERIDGDLPRLLAHFGHSHVTVVK